MPVHVNFLLRFPLLSQLPRETLEALAARMSRRSLARREVVMPRGETDVGLGFLLSGQLQGIDFTLDGREVGLYFVQPGDYFGELAVADGEGLPEFVVSLTKSEVLLLPPEPARELLFSAPVIAGQIIRRLAFRVRMAAAQRKLLSLPNPLQRLCAQLLLMAAEGGGEIPLLPTHQELAIMINTTRETVTRHFQVLQTRGLVRRDGERLYLVDPQRLQRIAEGAEA